MTRGRLFRLAAAAAALGILIIPTQAHAWGPLAHLEFSATALGQLGDAPSTIRLLLQEFGHDFLYGSLAADIVVGKNLAHPLYHCHRWRVGFNVYRRAAPGREQAFALGFLAHLAADTVAHNYFVPFKSVASFRKVRTGHGYWELRYDQQMDRRLTELARRVSTPELRVHDRLLQRTLHRASVLPFGVTRGLFGSVLASARHAPFQRLSRVALARERSLPLEAEVVAETRALAVDAIAGLLRELEEAPVVRVDPTGRRSLELASRLRRRLRARAGRGTIGAAEVAAVAAEARETFRASAHHRLIVPARLAKLAA